MANRQTGVRRALQQEASPSWEAQLIPRVPAVPGGLRSGYVPPPPPVLQAALEPIITSSFRAPEDVPLREPAVRPEGPRRGLSALELLRETFAQRRYGPARYRLHLDEARSGGRPGQQPLSLVSRKDSLPPIHCGWVDVAQGEAQVRSHGVLARRYERRHGHPLPLDEAEYDRFLDKLLDTLFDEGFQILHLVSDEEDLLSTDSRGAWLRSTFRSGRGVTVLVVGAFALGLNAAHLLPKLLQHAPAWSAHVGSWFAQASTWLSRLLSWQF